MQTASRISLMHSAYVLTYSEASDCVLAVRQHYIFSPTYMTAVSSWYKNLQIFSERLTSCTATLFCHTFAVAAPAFCHYMCAGPDLRTHPYD